MKKIGVILAGCGVYDGAEIQEAVLTLLALDRAGAQAVCFAPDIDQFHVVNHLTGQVSEGERRNVLVESARICRGEVTDLRKIGSFELDGLILPGGFGVAKNLCDYALKGTGCKVIPEAEAAIRGFYRAGKPVGFMCIAPALAAKVLGDEGIEVTAGCDRQTAGDIEAFGARHIDATVDAVVVSSKGKVVSTPAWMLGPSISQVAKGVDALVAKVLELS